MNTHHKTFIIIAITFLVGLILIGARALWHESPERVPTEPGQVTESIDQKAIASAYFAEHLTELSPTPAVLGGTFFPTLIYFPGEGVAIIEYEDGHIALTARATYTTEGKEVQVLSFTEFEDSFQQVGNLIKDNPGLLPGVWYLSFDTPGKAGNSIPLTFSQTTHCTKKDGTLCTTETFTQGVRVRILGDTTEEGVTVRRIEIIGA